MSQTSVSEAPIMAETVEVLDNITEHTISLNNKEEHKKLQIKQKTSTHRGFTTSTFSETSDHSSVLWTPQILPQKKTKSRRERNKGEKGRRLWNEEDIQEDMNEETSPFLIAQGQPTKPKQSCSFERHNQHNRSSHGSHHHNRSRRNTEKSSFRRSQGHKNRHELNNDYTKYQYHRRSHRDKHRKHNSLHKHKDETTNAHSGLPKIIQRIKDFFLGKKSEKRKNPAITQEPREHLGSQFKETSLQGRHNSRRHISQKLFRSASDSDIEVVKHHRRRQYGNEESRVKDDLCKDGRHWKTKRVRNEHKLSSICESSEKLGGLDRGSGSDGRLVLTKSGSTMYDVNFNAANKNKHKRNSKKNGQKMEKGTSDESRSQDSVKTKEKHRRRSKDYQNLKRKWAKQHQSFENDLEKLEKLVKSINMKKPHAWTEQKPLEDTTLLERLEAKQEKCVAEVDFTRHVLVCKLQRLENKLEESLSAADNNNNTNSKERRKTIEEIQEEMSTECRDLRKLLQETSDQLKQVLEERPTGNSQKDITNENNDEDGRKETQQESLSAVKTLSKNKATNHIDLKSNPNIPFPELSHHPLNIGRSHIVAKCVSEDNNNNNNKHIIATCVKEESSSKQHTRVSTYV